MSQGRFYVYISAGPDLEIRQPFHDSIFGTRQIRQPLQGRRISRVPKTTAQLVLQSSTAKVHEVELVINAREDLRDSRGVGDHAARTHDLGQVTPRHYGRWLVVDAAFEASWAPVHELNSTLGLDRGHGSVHILWHHISLPNTGCRLLLTNYMYLIYLHILVRAVK